MTTTHTTGTREEWLAARLDLLQAEKELTRRSDELAQRRQQLPWVRIDKSYQFDTGNGRATLADLFQGRSQLLVYHFMFGPDYQAGCPSCSMIADGFNGFAVHLANHDVTLQVVSRAPHAKLQAFKRRMGWSFPWASSASGDFNYDFNASFTEQQQREKGIDYNYRREAAWTLNGIGDSLTKGGEGPVAQIAATTGTDVATYTRERPGMSAFVREDGAIYHTYSTYSRGLDGLWGSYQWLDRAPLGRNETGVWWRRHDEYEAPAHAAGAACCALGALMWDMGEIPMPGGWALSAVWMPMCGQTWAGAAASFVGMWAVMMVAMMLPSLVPMLWGYRPAVAAMAAAGYFLVWTALGAIVFALGAVFAEVAMQVPAVARAVPLWLGTVVVLAGAYQFTARKARYLAGCRPSAETDAMTPAAVGPAWRYGMRLGLQCLRACAGLTAILLAIGVMDLRAMGLVTAIITAERLAPAGQRIAWAAGAVSIVAGVYLMGRAAWSL